MKKKENKSEKNNGFLSIAIIILVAVLARGATRAFFSQIKHKTATEKINVINEDMNNKLNKFETAEDAVKELKKNIKDDEVSMASIPMGFFMSANAIKEFCTPTGYIPQKYISTINSYQTGVDFDAKLIEIFVRAGANKQQAQYALEKQKETLKNQFNRLLENDYRSVLKVEPTFTKIEYCKAYDEHAEEIVSSKIKGIQEVAPETYKKYFIK